MGVASCADARAGPKNDAFVSIACDCVQAVESKSPTGYMYLNEEATILTHFGVRRNMSKKIE